MNTRNSGWTGLTTQNFLIPLLFVLITVSKAHADQTVFSNNFEANASGFVPGGSLAPFVLSRTNFPTDGGGLTSPNQSTWLGPIGYGIAKDSAHNEIVNLTLNYLIPGQTYTVAFDLFIGGSWDGGADYYGPDGWYFAVNGTRLVDTYFSNGDQNVDYGAYSPQRYSDTTYANPNGPDHLAFTGAEFYKKQGPSYTGYYGIYYFSHGAGNPVLTFTATNSSVTLEWARYITANNFDSYGDEYWALDNVLVTTTGLVVPTLNIRATTTNSVVVFWPSSTTGFTLQENTDLSTASWVTTGQGVTDDGTNKFIIVNPAVGKRFYRLSNP
jgi:hypothetical protein